MLMVTYSSIVLSDEVFLKNGDRLSGKVISKSDESLRFSTDYAGEIEVQWNKIKHLSTDEAVEVVLKDETNLNGKLSLKNELNQQIDDGGELKPLEVAQIATINPPEEPDFKHTGQINFGAEIDRGNTDEDDYHLDAEAELRWPKDRVRFAFDGDYEETDGRASKQEVDFTSAYDHFLTKKLFTSAALALEHDKFSDLELRTTIGAGLGYQIYDTSRTKFRIAGGPGYVWEDFDESQDQDYPVGLWALDIRHVLFDDFKLQAFHDHRYTQSLEDGDDFIVKSKTGLRIPLSKNLQATIQYNYDWDNAPGENAEEDDRETLITAGYKW